MLTSSKRKLGKFLWNLFVVHLNLEANETLLGVKIERKALTKCKEKLIVLGDAKCGVVLLFLLASKIFVFGVKERFIGQIFSSLQQEGMSIFCSFLTF